MAAIERDRFGDKKVLLHWNWHDRRIMSFINNFVRITKADTLDDVDRQKIKKTGRLRRSLYWKTWATAGGDSQVFEAKYIYYTKFVELAVGKGDKYNGPVPSIPGPRWSPIPVPKRMRKGRPHVVTEMRTQAQKFTAYARARFMFAGTIYMLYAMGGNQSAAHAYNRALQWALHDGAKSRK
jgi:hypothetical protein